MDHQTLDTQTPDTLTEADSAPAPAADFETVGLLDALTYAIKALEKEADTLVFATKMITARGELAVPEAKRDHARRLRLLAAIETLKAHRAGMRPY